MVEDCRTGGIGRDVKICRKRWMFVGLVGSDGTITIALFIKYLLGFIMRERRMTVCIYFSYIALYIFCVLGFQLSVSYVPKEFCRCWYQETYE